MGAWSACATPKWDSEPALFVSDGKELKETEDKKGDQRDERKVGERNIFRKTVLKTRLQSRTPELSALK